MPSDRLCPRLCPYTKQQGGAVESLSSGQVRDFAATTAILFAIYPASYILVAVVIAPAQAALLPGISAFASLLFLPHGVRVLAASLLGVKSIPAVVLGELAGNYLFWPPTDPVTLVMSALIAGSVTWVVFEALRALDVNAFYRHLTDEPPSFHTLLLAGIIASAANAFLLTSLVAGNMDGSKVLTLMAAFVLGDVTGLLAMVALAHYMMQRRA